jgi:hypothetical protein
MLRTRIPNVEIRILCFVNFFYYPSVRHWLSLQEYLFLIQDLLSLDPTFWSQLPQHSRCPRPVLLPPRRRRPTPHAPSRTPTSKQLPSAQQHHLTLPRRQPTTRALMRPHYPDGPVLHLSFPTFESRHGQRREQTRLLVTTIVLLTGGPPLQARAMNRGSSRLP